MGESAQLPEIVTERKVHKTELQEPIDIDGLFCFVMATDVCIRKTDRKK